MKINEVIKNKRKELNLTQEQMADYLGVSIPAVSKWEKGSSFPDITLVPALARLLKVDLNTLLCFNDSLTELEVNNFGDELVTRMMEGEEFDSVYHSAMDKIQEYPTCELLLFTVLLAMDSLMVLYAVENKEQYQEQIEKLYGRLLNSSNVKYQDHANTMLIARYMAREDYDKAEELINSLPDPIFDKTDQQASLYIQQERFPEATEILEVKMTNASVEMQTSLLGMVKIALKENRLEDAEHFANLYEKTTRLYSNIEFMAYSAHLEVSIVKKDADECLRILGLMLNSIKEGTDLANSPLRRNMEVVERGEGFGLLLVKPLLEKVKHEDEYGFLRNHPEYDKLLQRFDTENVE